MSFPIVIFIVKFFLRSLMHRGLVNDCLYVVGKACAFVLHYDHTTLLSEYGIVDLVFAAFVTPFGCQ